MWWLLIGFVSMIIAFALVVWWEGGLDEFFSGKVELGDVMKLIAFLVAGTLFGIFTPVFLVIAFFIAMWKSEKVVWSWDKEDES